jgi:hypothetical protein
MPNPSKGESMKDYVAKFMSSEEAIKDFPDEKQRYAVAMSKWKNKGKKKLSGKLGNLEMQASISEVAVNEETMQQYGLSLADVDQNGFHLIEGELMYLDEPCTPVVEGELKDKVKQFTFDSSKAEDFLASLKNKPIHINSNFDGHYDIAEDGSQDHTVVGSFLGGRIETKEDGSKVVKFLGGLYDKSLPKEVEEIKARKKDLGASFELNPTEIEIDEDSMIATVKSWVYKGAAILQKTFAAFPETSLLIAQNSTTISEAKRTLPYKDADGKIAKNDADSRRAKRPSAEGRNSMDDDKIYTQAELDEAIAKAKDEVKASVEATAKAEEVLQAKNAEITELKAQSTAKDVSIVSLTDKVKALETEKEEATISASVDKWWAENSKFYEEKDKETILSARRAVLKKEVTPEQIDSMLSARKVEKADVKNPDLLASGALKEGTDIDMRHGLKTKDGWKRTK